MTAEYTLFSNVPGTFTKIDHIYVHNISLNVHESLKSYRVYSWPKWNQNQKSQNTKYKILKYSIQNTKKSSKNSSKYLAMRTHCQDFPGGPVVKTPCFHCRVTSSVSGQGSSTRSTVQPKTKQKNTAKQSSVNSKIRNYF